jgi:hypothetical protein
LGLFYFTFKGLLLFPWGAEAHSSVVRRTTWPGLSSASNHIWSHIRSCFSTWTPVWDSVKILNSALYVLLPTSPSLAVELRLRPVF